MSKSHLVNDFFHKATHAGPTRAFFTPEGLRFVTLPDPPPPAVALPFVPLGIAPGSPWIDMRYIGHGLFVHRDFWLVSFTHRLEQARRRLG